MSPTRRPYADFQLGLWLSANSVGNINTAKSLQKSKKPFASSLWFRYSYLDYIYSYTFIISVIGKKKQGWQHP